MKASDALLLLWLGMQTLSACSGDGVGPSLKVPDPPATPALGQTWIHHASPVLTASASGWDGVWVATPAVVRFGGIFRMWYGGSASGALSGPIGIGYAASPDGISWQRASDAPVLAPRPGAWDHNHVQRPAVLVDGDTLRMWYGGGAHPGNHDIGYATSVDGLHWTRSAGPVLLRGRAGEWNAEFMSPGTVLEENGTFKMWFYSGVGLAPEGHWGTGRIEIGFATSPDGIEWTLYDDPITTEPPYEFSDPVLSPGPAFSWDADVVFSPSVRRVDSGYEMWYTGYNAATRTGFVGHATSPDGIVWTKGERNPVLSQASWDVGGFRPSLLVFPNVQRVGDRDLMWFAGWHSFPNRSAIGVAERAPD